MALIDGQVTGSGAIPNGPSYSALNQSFQMSHYSTSNNYYKPRYQGRRDKGQGLGEFGGNSSNSNTGSACD